MSEVRLVVREAQCDWSGSIHGSRADRAVAALSADPVTMDELEAAAARFAKRDPKRRFFANLAPGQNAEPYDAGLVVIDLAARLVVVNSTYSSPGREGYVCYHNGECCTDKELRYHLADDWLFTSESTNWKTVAEERRRQWAAKPMRDVRLVFYGQPLLEFIGRDCFAAFGQRDEVAAAVRAEWAENARIRLAKEANISPDQADASLLTEEKITPRTRPGQERYASLLADMPGPAFWGLDGCNMDDEFAFEIYHRTREEWEEEQRSREEFNKKFDAEWAERQRLGVESSRPSEDGSNAIWSRSFTVNEAVEVPLGVRVFGIGCHLAELIVGLRDGADREAVPPEAQRHIDQLNRDFGNLRDILQGADASLALALIDPVLNRFAETLESVAAGRSHLAEQCQSITDDLHKLLNPPSEDEGQEFPDEELPY